MGRDGDSMRVCAGEGAIAMDELQQEGSVSVNQMRGRTWGTTRWM